jgi:DNA mismatch endonuclease (patch repair protein)
MMNRESSRSHPVPRYDGCVPASQAASRTKRRNRSRDTSAELLLRKALWARGLRYRLHVRGLPGKPDIVFRRYRLAVFVDGDFWHGRDWDKRKGRLSRGANPTYWIEKIEYNMRRDREQTSLLTTRGWRVLRFWETDVARATGMAVAEISKFLDNAPSSSEDGVHDRCDSHVSLDETRKRRHRTA